MSEEVAQVETTQTATEETTTVDTALGGQAEQNQETTTQTETAAAPEEYKVEIDGFDFEAFKAIESNNELLSRAKELGFSNDQVQFMLKEYNDIIPQVFEAHLQLDTEKTVTGLKELWGNDYDASLGNAVKALKAAGFSDDDLSKPEIGNNMALAKLAAHFGSQMKEDALPTGQAPSATGQTNRIRELMSSKAYLDPSDPSYGSVKKEVAEFYAKGGKLND